VQQSNIIARTEEIERKIEPPFELFVSPGSIMMIPAVYEFEQYLDADAIIVQPNVHPIEDDEKEFFIGKLKNKENFAEWKIEVISNTISFSN
jgi:hypothetical protein